MRPPFLCAVFIVWGMTSLGCVSDDQDQRERLIEHFEKQQALGSEIENALVARPSVKSARASFGEDDITGKPKLVVIVEPNPEHFSSEEEQSLLEEIRDISGYPSGSIQLLRSR